MISRGKRYLVVVALLMCLGVCLSALYIDGLPEALAWAFNLVREYADKFL